VLAGALRRAIAEAETNTLASPVSSSLAAAE
jgi:hypothetical protein